MTAPEIHRATDELVAWLLATRTDWTDFDIRNAIAGATNLGDGWAQIATGLVRLALDPKGQPRTLTHASGTRHDSQATGGLPSSREAVDELAATRERLASIADRRKTDDPPWPVDRWMP